MKLTDILVLLSLFLSFNIGSQSIVFYNVENFFDCIDDPLTNDNEYTPDGIRRWTPFRQDDKCKSIAKVILAAGGWSAPAIVGMCEVENRSLLDQLVFDSPLRTLKYSVLHRGSPDHRGIDVALLYRKEYFKLLDSAWIPLKEENGAIKHTREILYCKGVLTNLDTVSIFVNHWPSRYGGAQASKPARQLAAQTLREHVDLLLQKDKSAKILIMGDFNDYPSNESLSLYLCKDDLVNLAASIDDLGRGSHKYQGKWGMLDQMIVTKNLATRLGLDNLKVFSEPFLLEDDPKYLGKRPFRTYIGMKYHGGFSDHLPIVLHWNSIN